jgi:Ca2+-binding RTX toxin-like protein
VTVDLSTNTSSEDSSIVNFTNVTGSNQSGDVLTGTALQNTLDGSGGGDILTGGGGADRFVLHTGLGAADTVSDFVSGLDSFQLSASEFGISSLHGSGDPGFNFVLGAPNGLSGTFGAPTLYYYYRFEPGPFVNVGELYYDPDGPLAGALPHLILAFPTATTPLSLATSDFTFVA